MNARRITLGLMSALCVLVLTAACFAADDPLPSAIPASQPRLAVQKLIATQLAQSADAKPDATATDEAESKEEEAKVDRFSLPDGGVPELIAFLQDAMKFRPTTREEAQQYQLRGRPAMQEAALKIQELATEEDKKLPGYDDVVGFMLMARSQNRDASADVRAQLLNDLKAYFVAHPEPSVYAMNAARVLASSLEYGGEPDEAIVVYRQLGSELAKSPDAKTAKVGQQMEGAARRLGLLGQPLEVTGTEMDGTKFDLSSLRGKVVLVDFWATWCGPCLAEMPNVKKNYELYHDKGFEVVGISLDRDREALEKYLADEQKPWITLHDGDWSDNEVATYYGVMGIPTVILVDKEGKVVSTRARGPELGILLAELLGPAEPAKSATDEKPAEEETKGTPKAE